MVKGECDNKDVILNLERGGFLAIILSELDEGSSN
jgi:hypothetical protein